MKDLEQFFSKEEMNERQIKLYQMLVFFAKLLAVGLVFQAILYIYPDTTGIQALLADLIAAVVNPIMKDPFTASGIEIVTKGEIYIITQDCLGWKSMAAFIALVFASSEKFLDHSKALIAGIGLIFVANVVRIVTTIFLAHGGI
ncbi:MAG: exosortase/archaeosortase family protein, partial [Candidatus Nanohalobium sp.]